MCVVSPSTLTTDKISQVLVSSVHVGVHWPGDVNKSKPCVLSLSPLRDNNFDLNSPRPLLCGAAVWDNVLLRWKTTVWMNICQRTAFNQSVKNVSAWLHVSYLTLHLSDNRFWPIWKFQSCSLFILKLNILPMTRKKCFIFSFCLYMYSSKIYIVHF